MPPIHPAGNLGVAPTVSIAPSPLLVDGPTGAKMLGVGLTHFYGLVRQGRIRLIKLGRSSRVSVRELEALVDALVAEAAA